MDQAAQLAAFVAGLKVMLGGDKFPHLGLVQALLDDYNADMARVARVELKFTMLDTKE